MRAIAIAISATAALFSVREGERSVETATKLRMRSNIVRAGGIHAEKATAQAKKRQPGSLIAIEATREGFCSMKEPNLP
ncbi:MAG: hypothetical protein C6P35_10755 [Cohnella sp.]|nr:MAG: hypothetical protein C6P35_10755 [Cohnella sp.]